MASYDPRAIANEFVKLNCGLMNQMQMQKLVFFANGWNLAINHEPLVAGNAEAWDGGPVFRIIWNHIRDYGTNPATGQLIRPDTKKPFEVSLREEEKKIIKHVWKKYGVFSGLELSEMTHEAGTPWSNAYFGRGRNSALGQNEIKKYFVELALAGRTQSTAYGCREGL